MNKELKTKDILEAIGFILMVVGIYTLLSIAYEMNKVIHCNDNCNCTKIKKVGQQ